MYDRALVVLLLEQIDEAIERIKRRTETLRSVGDLTDTPAGAERLDGLCMLFMAIGEALKNLNKITAGGLLTDYPDIDWRGVIGFRDIIAHHYFDIDAEQVFWVCTHEIGPLSATIKRMLDDLRGSG